MESTELFLDTLHAHTTWLPLSDGQARAMARHWELTKRWNERLNLTSILDDRDAAMLHYCDSLEVCRVLEPGTVLDVGSGAGFPGIPLAIATHHPVTLLEPRNKRATFLHVVRSELPDAKLTIATGRSTDDPFENFENVVTRATFSEPSDLEACLRWASPKGQLIAMRAPPASPHANATHTYEISSKQRVLEIWRPK